MGQPRDLVGTADVTYSAARRSTGWLPADSGFPLCVCGASSSGLPTGPLKPGGHLPCQSHGIASQRAYVKSGQPNGAV